MSSISKSFQNRTLKLSNQSHSSYQLTIFFLLWSGLEIYRCLSHGMWRDEMQPWLVGLYSNNLIELYQNRVAESHPMGWFILTWIVSRFTKNPVGLQLITISCSILSVWLLYFKSKFKLIEKLALSFSYLLFFEYSIISRSYTLAFTSIALFCSSTRLWLKYLFLGILANTSFYGWIISVPLSFELFWQNRNSKESEKASIGIYLTLCLFGLISVLPASNKLEPPDWFFGFNLLRLAQVSLLTLASIFPMSSPFSAEFLKGVWNPYLFVSAPLALQPLLAIVTLFLFRNLFGKNRKKALVFYCGTLGVIFFNYFIRMGSVRHLGHIFMLLIACRWSVDPAPNSIDSLNSIGRNLWNTLLIVGFLGSLQTLLPPLSTEPISMAKAAGTFLQKQKLTDLPILGYPDYLAMPVVGYAETPFFYPNYNRYGTFLIDSPERNVKISPQELTESIISFINRNEPKPSILVLSEPAEILGESLLKSANIQLIQTFISPHLIYTNEGYYIYQASKR